MRRRIYKSNVPISPILCILTELWFYTELGCNVGFSVGRRRIHGDDDVTRAESSAVDSANPSGGRLARSDGRRSPPEEEGGRGRKVKPLTMGSETVVTFPSDGSTGNAKNGPFFAPGTRGGGEHYWQKDYMIILLKVIRVPSSSHSAPSPPQARPRF